MEPEPQEILVVPCGADTTGKQIKPDEPQMNRTTIMISRYLLFIDWNYLH
jgi:hypothetical protein